MSMQNDVVRLLIDGKTHQEWSSYDIDSNFQTPADAWSVGLGLPNGELPDVVAPGASVEVKMGENTVLKGIASKLILGLAIIFYLAF